MKITIFSSLMTKEAEGVIDATEWIRDIRDGKFKPTVDQVRYMIKLGDKDRVRDWKMKLPAAVWAGECRKGRFFKHTTSRTGYAIFDFDDLRDDLAARQFLEVFPWIVAVHVTASGRGLRVVANIGIVHIDVYRQAYEQVAERLHEITGLELDMACKDFARASLASYDPEIYYNPKATVFPYGEEHNPLNYVPATGPTQSPRRLTRVTGRSLPKEPLLLRRTLTPPPTWTPSSTVSSTPIHMSRAAAHAPCSPSDSTSAGVECSHGSWIMPSTQHALAEWSRASPGRR